eukprot:TRINITY_DN44968_c0_g1_i2.p1 TRINITY_DN44968_c0_g1~~TRINITY_DN44968_c0_g1_i2.p1  ORF type:complete len:264 (+),score=45.88 TRINITY_DN44968_c0_g1_i2:85-876(+)
MMRRPPRSTLSSSSAASDVYKRQVSTHSTGAGARRNSAATPMRRFRGLSTLSHASRAVLSVRAALTALCDPERADMVAALGETTAGGSLDRMLHRMKRHEVGRELLDLRPRITEASLDLPRLRTLPRSSFGRQYALYMDDHGFSPDARPAVQYIDDPELAFVMTRYREVHDFWHVLSGLPPSELGEISLKWFEAVQTGLPMCFLSAVVGPARLSLEDKEMLLKQHIPWATSAAAQCEDLMCVRYEDHLERLSLIHISEPTRPY